MSTLRNCLNFLDAQCIAYSHTTHSPAYTADQTAAAEHIPAHRLAKTVVCKDSSGYLLVVIPSNSHTSAEHLKLELGVPELILVGEDSSSMPFPAGELEAMPPLGTLFGMRVYLDKKLAEEEFIAFRAGTHRDLIHMRCCDFKQLVQPTVGDFSQLVYHFSSCS